VRIPITHPDGRQIVVLDNDSRAVLYEGGQLVAVRRWQIDARKAEGVRGGYLPDLEAGALCERFAKDPPLAGREVKVHFKTQRVWAAARVIEEYQAERRFGEETREVTLCRLKWLGMVEGTGASA
jgi:hypothetical protein